jgi:hypothetical protein
LRFGAARIVFIFFQTFCRQKTPKKYPLRGAGRATKNTLKTSTATTKKQNEERTGHLLSLNNEKKT